MAWEENSCISLNMQLIAILSRIGVFKKAQTAIIILPGLPQPPIIYGEVCANGATSR